MKTARLALSFGLAVLALLAAGCSSNRIAYKPLEYLPEWWNTQPDQDYVHVYGTDQQTSLIAAREGAKANVYIKSPQYVKPYLQKLMNEFVADAGITEPDLQQKASELVESVSATRFSDSLLGETETILVSTAEGELYKNYLQVAIPRSAIAKTLVNRLKSEEDILTRLENSLAYLRFVEGLK